MDNEECQVSVWFKLKHYIFLKLGRHLWPYMMVHTDYWHRFYGISFTHRRDFPKLFKYDMIDIDDDIEVEIAKARMK